MKTRWFTFGQNHTHRFVDVTLDCDIAVEITAEDPRAEMFRLFGAKWGMEYDERPEERFIPRGVIQIGDFQPAPTHDREEK